jgi:hypothetical protein
MQNKRSLWLPEFAGDIGHQFITQCVCIRNDSHRITGERPLGKDIDEMKWNFHGAFTARARLSRTRDSEYVELPERAIP